MKKNVLVVLGLFLASGPALFAGYRVAIKGSFFSSENTTFRDVYGSAAKFGLEGGLNLSESFSLWAGLDYLHRSGKLTLTGEKTQVSLLPASAGARYEFPVGTKLRFHLGAGLQKVFFKEESILGSVKENAFGFIARGGGVYRLTENIGVGLFLSWSTCKMTHESLDFKVGGLDFGAAVELRF